MNEIKILQKEIKKIIKTVDNRITYKAYETIPLIKDCNNTFLKENFSEWRETEKVLGAIFNLSKYYYTIDEIKSQLKQIERNFAFNISYWVDGEEYYIEKIQCVSPFDECILSILSTDKIEYFIKNQERQKEEFVALSKLKDYELNHPNQKVWDSNCWNDLPKKLTKQLIKEGLIIKPSKKEEWFMF